MDINKILNKLDELNFEMLPKSAIKQLNEIKTMMIEYRDNNFLPEIKSYETNNKNCLFEVKGRNNLHGGIIKVFGVIIDKKTLYPLEKNSYFLVWNYEKKEFEWLSCDEFEPIHENQKDDKNV